MLDSTKRRRAVTAAVISYRSRIWILEELIRHAQSKPQVWFATHEQVTRHAAEHAEGGDAARP